MKNTVLTEDINTELKREYTPNIIKTVIAFANTKGGRVYIGIDDDGAVTGVTDPGETLLQITNALRDSIKPDITMFTKCTAETLEGKNIITIEVAKGTSAPYYLASKGISPKGVFIRQGSSTAPASFDAIKIMIKETSGDTFEAAVSLNQDLTFNYTEKVFKDNSLDFSEAKMKALGLINDEGLYTNLALLLSEQSPYTLKMAVFQDAEMQVFKNRHEFSGSLFKQIDEIYANINVYNETRAVFEGLKRSDSDSYPPQALREALLNCFCHRDYSLSTSASVSIFPDRIEFLNPGGLLSGITEADIQLGLSALRNKKLADILYRLNYIEAYGTGIVKINRSYSASPNKPLFEITPNAFKVTLPNKNYNTSLMPPAAANILTYAAQNSPFTRSALQNSLGLSKSTAVAQLKTLCEKQLLTKSGKGKNTVYSAAK